MNGWNEITGQTNHTELQRYVAKLIDPAFVAKDAHEALTANPYGKKAGYYADLVCYCGMRISGALRATR